MLTLVPDETDPYPHAAERQALGPVITALDAAAKTLPDASEWKWACLGIRRHLADSVGLCDAS